MCTSEYPGEGGKLSVAVVVHDLGGVFFFTYTWMTPPLRFEYVPYSEDATDPFLSQPVRILPQCVTTWTEISELQFVNVKKKEQKNREKNTD